MRSEYNAIYHFLSSWKSAQGRTYFTYAHKWTYIERYTTKLCVISKVKDAFIKSVLVGHLLHNLQSFLFWGAKSEPKYKKNVAYLMTTWKFSRTVLNGLRSEYGNIQEGVNVVSYPSGQNISTFMFPQTTCLTYFSFPLTFPVHRSIHDAIILSAFGAKLCDFICYLKRKINLLTY
jgi:hypothetical protein